MLWEGGWFDFQVRLVGRSVWDKSVLPVYIRRCLPVVFNLVGRFRLDALGSVLSCVFQKVDVFAIFHH